MNWKEWLVTLAIGTSPVSGHAINNSGQEPSDTAPKTTLISDNATNQNAPKNTLNPFDTTIDPETKVQPTEHTDSRKKLAQSLKKQSLTTYEILTTAKEKGLLPEIKLTGFDKWLIEDGQQTLEQRIAALEKERNDDYLESQKIWGSRYQEANKDKFTFGNWNKINCDNYAIRAACSDKSLSYEEQLANKKKFAEMTGKKAYLNASQIRNPTNWKLNDSDVVYETREMVVQYNQACTEAALAARGGQKKDISHVKQPVTSFHCPLLYNPTDGKIYVNREIMKPGGYKPLSEASLGNRAALNCLIYHELNHRHNYEHDGLGQLSYTPINAIKGDVLTEKLSLCTEYFHMVKEYNDSKARGDATIKYDDGTEKPLDSLLDIYPGLQNVVQKYGTNLDNPQTKKAIVTAAMNYWETERKESYQNSGGQTERIMMDGHETFNLCSFSKQMELLKNEEETYRNVSTAMMSAINIGDQQIDLNDCKDLIDTFTTKDAKKMIADHNEKDTFYDQRISMPSYQEYQEINAYLESIGKKTDEEKMEHIAKTVRTASFSFESYDRQLESIILLHNSQITSGATGIERTSDAIIAICGDHKFDITEYAVHNATSTKKAEMLAQSQQMMPSITLSRP